MLKSFSVMLVFVLGFAFAVEAQEDVTIYKPTDPWTVAFLSFGSPGVGQNVNAEGGKSFWHWIVGAGIDSLTGVFVAACNATGIDESARKNACGFGLGSLIGSIGWRVWSAIDAFTVAEARYDFYLELIEARYGPQEF